MGRWAHAWKAISLSDNETIIMSNSSFPLARVAFLQMLGF